MAYPSRYLPFGMLATLVLIACGPAPGYRLGGTLSGLGPGKALTLTETESGTALRVGANGPFAFPRRLSPGAAYRVELTEAPRAQGCVVQNGEGVAGADVLDVRVRCGDSGRLDPSFGRAGTAITPLSTLVATAQAAVPRPDGRLLVAGERRGGSYPLAALARFDADGHLDAGFATGGRALADLGGSFYGAALALTENRIVLGGSVYNGHDTDFVLLGYRPDGSPDPGFGSGGRVLTDLASGSNDYLRSLVVLPGGRLVAGGRSGDGFALVGYRPDGGLDPGFGLGGKVRTPVGGGGVGIYALAVDAEGRIVAAGRQFSTAGYDLAVARYRSDGTLDTAFGGGHGYVLLDYAGKDDGAWAVAALGDGSLLLGGEVEKASGGSLAAVARLLPDGGLDPSFGNGGWAVLEAPLEGGIRALAVQPDGRIVVAGHAFDADTGNEYFLLARLLPDGGLDPEFGDGGVTRTLFAHDAWVNALVLVPDGRIVVAGYARDASEGFALARYWP